MGVLPLLGSDRENIRVALDWSLAKGDGRRLTPARCCAARSLWFSETPVKASGCSRNAWRRWVKQPSPASVQALTSLGFLHISKKNQKKKKKKK